jgi:predicted GH43/DUF377 family glycosyl hydrolase
MSGESDRGCIYSACAALLDLNDPPNWHGSLALFSPEYEWELHGEVNNVVFPTVLPFLEILCLLLWSMDTTMPVLLIYRPW